MVYFVQEPAYIYAATAFFAGAALSSDLLFVRSALMMGFFFLVLTSLSGGSLDGSISMDTLLFVNGKIEITPIVNACLFLLNLVVVSRFISDEIPKGKLNEEERALYQFFNCRCGLTRLQFDEILKQGQFLEMDADVEVPFVESTIYLVLEGVVECHTRFSEETKAKFDTFLKRSGQFFDIKLFNLFTLPVGFDANEFRAKTITKTKLFGWTAKGLIEMRESHSPALLPFWEYIVLRTLADAAVRHHLQDTDTVYDAWLVPEDPDWLEGAQSRDFRRPTQPEHGWAVASRQFCMMFSSLLQAFPPRGLRHQTPCMTLKRNPVQDCIEVMAKAKQEVVEKISDAAMSDKDYQFLSKRLSNPATEKDDFVYKHVSSPSKAAHAKEARDLETAATATIQEKEPGEEADCYVRGKQMPSDEESLA
jgi:hypothetical protein